MLFYFFKIHKLLNKVQLILMKFIANKVVGKVNNYEHFKNVEILQLFKCIIKY